MKLVAIAGMIATLFPAAFGTFNGITLLGIVTMAISIPLILIQEVLRRD